MLMFCVNMVILGLVYGLLVTSCWLQVAQFSYWNVDSSGLQDRGCLLRVAGFWFVWGCWLQVADCSVAMASGLVVCRFCCMLVTGYRFGSYGFQACSVGGW